MTIAFFRKNRLFYTALFCVWALFLLVRYGGHRYFDSPPPSAGTPRISGGSDRETAVRNGIVELRKNILKEKSSRKPQPLENLGYAYFDLYKETGDRGALDSALFFINQAIAVEPQNAQRHYNLGALFSEVGDAAHALAQYDLAVRCDPANILALSNAATCAYFNLGQRAAAAPYCARILAIDSLFPGCHQILGFIGLDEGNYDAARDHFEKEIVADRLALGKSKYRISPENVRFTATIARYNLSMLYAVKFPDRGKARERAATYLSGEVDSSSNALAALDFVKKKYWGGDNK
jgi:tetratricopeptide (TPR) repeat protein